MSNAGRRLASAALSGIYPGIGQWYGGRRASAVVYAVVATFLLLRGVAGLAAGYSAVIDRSREEWLGYSEALRTFWGALTFTNCWVYWLAFLVLYVVCCADAAVFLTKSPAPRTPSET